MKQSIMADGYFVDTTERIETLKGVVRRTMGTTDEVMLCEFTLEAGAEVPRHSHMNDQAGYVISGKLELTIGDVKRVLTAGDSYAIPGGIEHGAKIIETAVVIDAFSPPRNDYRTEAR